MIALKMLLTVAGVLMMAAAVTLPLYGVWLRIRYELKRKAGGDGMLLESGVVDPEPAPIAWRGPAALALVACIPILIAMSLVVVPSGMGGVRISQIGGTEPGTLYPGLHFVTPLVESVQMFDLRDHIFTAGVVDSGKPGINNSMTVQSREGLNIGMAVTVRYRLDPNKLASVQAHLEQPGQDHSLAQAGQRLARDEIGAGARQDLEARAVKSCKFRIAHGVSAAILGAVRQHGAVGSDGRRHERAAARLPVRRFRPELIASGHRDRDRIAHQAFGAFPADAAALEALEGCLVGRGGRHVGAGDEVIQVHRADGLGRLDQAFGRP